MKILHCVEFYHPSKGGAQEVVRQLSERLVQRGHDVTVATTRLAQRQSRQINGVKIVEFDVGGNFTLGLRGDAGEFRRYLRENQFDVVMNYAAQQWTADAFYEVLDDLSCAKIMAPCGFSGLRNPDYAAYFAYLPTVLAKYDRLIFHSDTYQDIAFARQHGLGKLATVIPNGAGADEFENAQPGFRQRYGIPANVPMLLTVGSHSNLKGHGRSIEATALARIGAAVLVIIGNEQTGGCQKRCRLGGHLMRAVSLGRRRLLMLDPPRAEVVAAYHEADLFVLPSNIECSPLVLFEAMASSLPFLTTDVGNAREIVQWSGGAGKIVATWPRDDHFVHTRRGVLAREIEAMLRDQERLAAMGKAGRSAWEANFRWEDLIIRYEEVYRAAVEKREPKLQLLPALANSDGQNH